MIARIGWVSIISINRAASFCFGRHGVACGRLRKRAIANGSVIEHMPAT